MSQRRRALGLVLLGAAAVILAAACSPGPPKIAGSELAIAVDVPLTGPQAGQGAAVADAVREVARDEFHSRIEGLPIRLAMFDHSLNQRRDNAQAEKNMRKMVADRHLLGMIGPLNSDIAAGQIPLANAAHLVMISPAASHPCLTRPAPACDGLAAELRPAGPNDFFRLVASEDGQSAALAEYGKRTLHLTRVAVASDSQTNGKSLAAGFELAARRRGLVISARRDLDPTSDQAVDGFLAAARAAAAEAVFFAGDPQGGACRVRARMKDVFEADTPFLVAAGGHGASCLRDAGPLAAGMYTADSAPADLAATAQLAARVLLRAVAAAVKGAGGNLPTREEVRLAVSRSSEPGFDVYGDSREQTFSMFRSDASPAWAAAGPITLPAGG